MPDRMRESVFNILGSKLGMPGMLPAIGVADVFAGSGSLGLEALSRGAERCLFYEQDRDAVNVLRENLHQFQVGAEASVIRVNAWTTPLRAGDGDPLELIFLDPPYRDSRDSSPAGLVWRFLNRLADATDHRLETGATFSGNWPMLVVLHHERRVIYPQKPCPGWFTSDRRNFGTSAVTFIERCPSPAPHKP